MDGTTDVAAERTGKITPAQFGTWIAPHLGAARPEVLLGPRAGTDCGIGSRVGHPQVGWAKFQAMAEGARIASKELWGG